MTSEREAAQFRDIGKHAEAIRRLWTDGLLTDAEARRCIRRLGLMVQRMIDEAQEVPA